MRSLVSGAQEHNKEHLLNSNQSDLCQKCLLLLLGLMLPNVFETTQTPPSPTYYNCIQTSQSTSTKSILFYCKATDPLLPEIKTHYRGNTLCVSVISAGEVMTSAFW